MELALCFQTWEQFRLKVAGGDSRVKSSMTQKFVYIAFFAQCPHSYSTCNWGTEHSLSPGIKSDWWGSEVVRLLAFRAVELSSKPWTLKIHVGGNT